MLTLLVFLNTLEVHHCKLVERIFEIEEWSGSGGAGDVNQVLVPFTILHLSFLPNLKHVWNTDPNPTTSDLLPQCKESGDYKVSDA